MRESRVDIATADHSQATLRTNVVLTVIVPVYNEAATVGKLLTRVFAADYEKEVIVVDDGSSDATGSVLVDWEKRPGVTVLRHEANRGKGAAIRTALSDARGRFVIVQDADLEYDPRDYSRLVGPLLDGRADVVYGSRRLAHKYRLREWFNPFCHGVSALNFLRLALVRNPPDRRSNLLQGARDECSPADGAGMRTI